MSRVEKDQPAANLPGLQEAIGKGGFDAVVTLSPDNVAYSAGVVVWTQRLLRDRLALVIWPREGTPTFLIATQEESYVRERSWIEDVRGYVVHRSSPIQILAKILEEKGLAAGRIGIELSYLTAESYRELVQVMPEAQLLSCEGLFQQVRKVKTPAEVDLLSRAAVATDKAIVATYATVRPGDRERSLVARLSGNLLQAGADTPAFLYLTVGTNTAYAHPDPTEYQVQAGELVKTDCGGFFSGYYSDVARTAVVGKATPEQRSIYERLMEVHRSTIGAMRPGALACAVFNAAVQEYRRVNIPFGLSFAGHGIGLSLHEAPMLSADDTTPLEPNMVFCVETRVRWPGRGGYHIEDTIVISQQGPQVVTNFMDTSRLLEL